MQQRKSNAFPPGIAQARSRKGAQPLFVCLGVDYAETSHLLELSSLKQSEHQGWRREDICWHYSQGALWLHAGTAMLPEGDLVWQPYLHRNAEALAAYRLGGIVCVLDAERMLTAGRETIRSDASRLRMRIDEASQVFGRRLPVYLFLSRIDALYGMKSLIAQLPPARVEKPLGALRMEQGDPPGKFAARMVRQAAVQLELTRPGHATVSPAAFHAPTELRRLAEPLGFFCEKAFLDNPYQTIGMLRGVFLSASERRARTLPPGNISLQLLPPEKNAGTQISWFLTETVGTILPADSGMVGLAPMKKRASVSALLFGLFALCLCLTSSFIEAKLVLEQFAAGELSPPQLAARNAGWPLPRFGMVEPVLLEQRHAQPSARELAPEPVRSFPPPRPAPPAITIAPVPALSRPLPVPAMETAEWTATAPPPPTEQSPSANALLQQQWNNSVYLPVQLMDAEERLARLVNSGGLLEKFLIGPALGLWRMENGKLVARRDNVSRCTLSPEFFAYCNWAISQGKQARPESLSIPLRIHSVSANRESREKPIGMDIEWHGKNGRQTLNYRNFSAHGVFTWIPPTPPRLTVRVHFPAFSISREYTDAQSVRRFFGQLAEGGLHWQAEHFPERMRSLADIGLTSLTIRSGIESPEEFFKWLDFAEPDLPEHIVDSVKVENRPVGADHAYASLALPDQPAKSPLPRDSRKY